MRKGLRLGGQEGHDRAFVRAKARLSGKNRLLILLPVSGVRMSLPVADVVVESSCIPSSPISTSVELSEVIRRSVSID